MKAQTILLFRMKPLGLKLPVINRVMLLIFILGILGIVIVIPSFRTVSPSVNGSKGPSLSLPYNNSSALSGSLGRIVGNATLNPVLDIPPVATPSPVNAPVAPPKSSVTPSRRNVTPFLASLAAVNPGPVSMPADLRPVGNDYGYKDNNRKQIVSVGVSGFNSGSFYSYHFRDPNIPDIITVPAKKGHRFFFIGVTCDLTGIEGGGSRTTFMTPAISSFKLINRGVTYNPVDPESIKDILGDGIINFGTLAREKSIDKDNPLNGILIYEVPITVTARESYIEFCPTNTRGQNQPHSPAWDCEKDTVRWSIVP